MWLSLVLVCVCVFFAGPFFIKDSPKAVYESAVGRNQKVDCIALIGNMAVDCTIYNIYTNASRRCVNYEPPGTHVKSAGESFEFYPLRRSDFGTYECAVTNLDTNEKHVVNFTIEDIGMLT